ncbi:hypothetical protein PHMEG_00026650 [Phytophthora megakarya]|uniref:Eukaryotic/viral aspartic protease n=1 Tax=Phytophthora megakarya TaxID=4795 RepID=A0A225V8S8_9STRA|nr:hypothetical protein PHMEG_00026650 [Phytophthora megakarya]
MLHDAGYASLNLVPTWGRTLSPELLAAQDGQFMSDVSFLWGLLTIEQALDPETAFPVEDDGDGLMLTLEEQDLASGDAPMLTPDENMSSAGGGSQGSPGMECSTAMVSVFMATTGSGTGPSNVAEQPTFYVPVAEYPPGQDARLPPRASTPTPPITWDSNPDGLDEETNRLSHNQGTKAWVQQLPESVRRSWRQLSDRFYKEFCRSMESPVQRYLRLKQAGVSGNAPDLPVETQRGGYQGQRGLPLRLRMPPTLEPILKNLRDRELQLSLQGRLYFTTDELEDVLKQVEEMEQGMRRKPANDVQFGRHNPGSPARGGSGAYVAMAAPKIPEPPVPDPEDLRWEDKNDSGYGYQYDEENDEAYDGVRDTLGLPDPRFHAPCATSSGTLGSAVGM